MEKLDYEPGSEEPDIAVWRTLLPFVPVAIAVCPCIYPQIFSHGYTSREFRLVKLLFLLGFIAAYGLTRVEEKVWRVFGWLLLAPYSPFVAVTAWSVVQALIAD